MPYKVATALLIFFALWASAAGVLRAQSVGRLSLTLLDAEGEPLPGARVRVTCAKLPRFEREATSDKKGRVLLTFPEGTTSYRLQIEKEGFHPVDTEFQPRPGELMRQSMHLLSVRAQPTAAQQEAAGRRSAAAEALAAGVEALREGDPATAEGHILRALEQDSALGPAHSALAGLYLQQGQYEQALAAAQRLLELEPENPRGFRALYEAHKALGHGPEAEAALHELSQLGGGGETAAILYNEGVEGMRAGDAATAKARFQEALGIDPNFLPAVVGLALCHLREGSFEEAAAAAERALELEPGNLQAMGARLDAYRALGDEDKEQEALEALKAADPKTASRQLFDGGIDLFNAGDTEGAKELFLRAAELDPENAAAHYKLGLCYINSGKTAAAKEHLQRFLELAPDHPDAAGAREMLGYLD
jgi:tetratricopeptide (TPR) repeat protein